MSNIQDEDIKRWTAKRKSALVLDIIQGKVTIAVNSYPKLKRSLLEISGLKCRSRN